MTQTLTQKTFEFEKETNPRAPHSTLSRLAKYTGYTLAGLAATAVAYTAIAIGAALYRGPDREGEVMTKWIMTPDKMTEEDYEIMRTRDEKIEMAEKIRHERYPETREMGVYSTQKWCKTHQKENKEIVKEVQKRFYKK